MRTSKPISTISYNSPEFLTLKLEELVRNHKISNWMFIEHLAEADERKNHIHLFIKPNTLLDTLDLQKFFEELDLNQPTKPKKCIDFRVSSEDDWILYSQHYSPYLASKNESREFVYDKSDFYFHDEDTFEDSYYHAFKGSEWAKRNATLQLLNDGSLNPSELILCGAVPLNLASQLNAFKYMQKHYGSVTRGFGQTHEEENYDYEE